MDILSLSALHYNTKVPTQSYQLATVNLHFTKYAVRLLCENTHALKSKSLLTKNLGIIVIGLIKYCYAT